MSVTALFWLFLSPMLAAVAVLAAVGGIELWRLGKPDPPRPLATGAQEWLAAHATELGETRPLPRAAETEGEIRDLWARWEARR